MVSIGISINQNLSGGKNVYDIKIQMDPSIPVQQQDLILIFKKRFVFG